jgi:putative DNA primase/helicase
MIDVYLEQYGARLFPLRPRTQIGDSNCKKPLIEDWPNANFTREELLGYWESGHPIAWALGPGDLVVDVDAATPDRPDKKGLESLAKLERILSAALDGATVEVQAPSKGRHFYFTKPAELAIRKKLKELPDIEFLTHGQYVVIAGSPHWQGGNYHFSSMTEFLSDYQRQSAPAGLMGMLKRDVAEPEDGEEPTTVSAALLAKMLDELEVTNYRDQHDWFRLMAASHSAAGGSLEGMEVFIAWSTRDPQYSEAGGEISHRWQSLKERPGGISIATLFEELKKLGRGDVVRMVKSHLDFDRVEPEATIPDIEYSLDEMKVNQQVVAALTGAKNLFQRAGALVQITDSGIAPVSSLTLCEIASSVCRLVRFKETDSGGEWVPTRIPERVGRQVIARGSWFGVPTLRSIVNTPVFTAHGVLQCPGFDIKSGVFYRKTVEVEPIPERPSWGEARAAADRLLDIVVDFPFAGPAHRANWLAGLLSVFARPAIEGPVPIFLIDGNQAAVGKSLLVDACNLIAYGAPAPRAKLSSDDEEVAKTLLSVAMQNYGVYVFDNLENGADFGSPSLDAVLTSRSVRGRILGQNRIADAEIDTIFWATGNRVSINKDSDSFRRIAFISLVCLDGDPKSRSGFRHGGNEAEFTHWVLANRSQFIRDALVILQAASQAEDRPLVKPWGSYSAFSDIVRRAIVWLGEPDPMESRADVEMFNEDQEELATVVLAVQKFIGVDQYKTAGQIYADLKLAAELPSEESENILAKSALEILAPSYYKDPAKAVAKKLRARFRDRPVGNMRIKASKAPGQNQLSYGVTHI